MSARSSSEKRKRELVERIAAGKVVVVVGAGVSYGATGGRPEALWQGLLASGVDYCHRNVSGLPDGWRDRQRAAVDGGDTDEMISVAELLTRKLGGPGDPRYRKWLEATVGSFTLGEVAAEARSVLECLQALDGLGVPLATTNYDGLLAEVTGKPPVTWREPERALAVLSGEEPGIVHLHGHWREPESVILGVRSYDELSRHEAAQTLQKLLTLFHSVLFVGCGAGLSDANLSALLGWLRQHFAGQRHRHYRLCLAGEVAELEREHAGDRIFPLAYGPDHEALPPYLRKLLEAVRGAAGARGGKEPEDHLAGMPPRPEQPAGPGKKEAALQADAALTAYRAWALERYGRLDMVGVGAGDLRLDFREVYVALRLGRRPAELEAGLMADKAGEEAPSGRGRKARTALEARAAAEDVDLLSLFTGRRGAGPHALLLGEPGAGKTTALRKLLHECLTTGPGALGLPAGTLPVFLRLVRLGEEDLGEPLGRFVGRELAEVAEGRVAAEVGERLWQRGRLLLLLDGLDEIADEDFRARVCQALQWQLGDAGKRGVRAVVACRRAGYSGERSPEERGGRPQVELGPGFVPYEVRPLGRQQVSQLIQRWFREAQRALPWIVEKEGTPALPRVSEAEARQIAKGLIASLETAGPGSQRLQVLVGTPLLLTLLCVVVLRGGEMPRQRAQFYDQCLRVLLSHWGKTQRGARPLLDVETALALLRSLAYELHCQRRRADLSTAELALHAEEHLPERSSAPAGEVDGFAVLDWLHREAGVLADYGSHQYGFAHLGFQEYLAAQHIALGGGDLVAALVDRLEREAERDWWREVVQLTVGLPGRQVFGDLLRGLLASPLLLEEADLLRACLEEAVEVELEPFLEVLKPAGEAVRQAAVLRLLRGRREPSLVEAARQLTESEDKDVRALARQVVEGARREEEEEAARPPFDLFLLAHPADAAAAAELSAALAGRGLRLYEPSRPEEWQGELPRILAQSRGVGVVVGPAGGAPWRERPVRAALQLFARRGRPMVVLQWAEVEAATAWPEELPEARWVDLREGVGPGVVAEVEQALRLVEAQAARAAVPGISVPGEPFTEPLTGLRLLWVPGGRFRMGGTAYANEQPIHRVRLSPFWLAETPVTNRQYAVFLERADVLEPEYWRDRRFSAPEQPVVGVSWQEAMEFCRWLSEEMGIDATLPTEAQWELAARGEKSREYPWGPEEPDESRACFGQDWEKGKPAPVGSYPAGAGPYGHLDLAGNVWEWCRDVWDEKAYERRKGKEVLDPMVKEGEDAELRVVRGGGWFLPAGGLRSAFRLWYLARLRLDDLGFRVAVVPASP